MSVCSFSDHNSGAPICFKFWLGNSGEPREYNLLGFEILSWVGRLLKRKLSFPVKKNDQERVNGGSNYEYLGQRWVPKLVYYITFYYHLSICLLRICLVCLSVYHSTCLLIICLTVYLYCLIMYRKQVYSPRTRLITRIRLIIRDQIRLQLRCAQAHDIDKNCQLIFWMIM